MVWSNPSTRLKSDAFPEIINRIGLIYIYIYTYWIHFHLHFSDIKKMDRRRIAELKKQECQDAVEEVVYMLVLHKFWEMRVHLVPRLSRCVCNCRLEIWPSKEWELESIHSFEVLQMVREHLNTITGCRADSNWAITEIQRFRLCRLYASSILCGYFLKSASLRHFLERGLNQNTSIYMSRVMATSSLICYSQSSICLNW